MANVKNIQISPKHFFYKRSLIIKILSFLPKKSRSWSQSNHFRDIRILNFVSPNSRSRSQSNLRNYIIRWQMSTSSYVCHKLLLFSYRFTYITILNCWPQKSRSRSWRAIFTITPLDAKFQNVQTSFFHLWFLLRCETILTGRYLHTHKQTSPWL